MTHGKKIFVTLLLLLVAAGASAETPVNLSLGPSEELDVVVCKGLYRITEPRTDTWVIVECPTPTSICSCNANGVNCGSNFKSAPAGHTYTGLCSHSNMETEASTGLGELSLESR